MHCPEQIVFNRFGIYLCCHTRADYMHGAPWSELLNPLRYQLTINPGPNRITINRNGRAQLHWSNFNWWLWRRRYKEWRKS